MSFHTITFMPVASTYTVLAADEGLRGQNILFINSMLGPLLKQVLLTSMDIVIMHRYVYM